MELYKVEDFVVKYDEEVNVAVVLIFILPDICEDISV